MINERNNKKKEGNIRENKIILKKEPSFQKTRNET